MGHALGQASSEEEILMTSKDVRWLVTVMLLFGIIVLHAVNAHVFPTNAERQAIIDGYDLCMKSASLTRCRMDPTDFVEYYRHKHALERPD